MAAETKEAVEELLADLAAVFEDDSADSQPDPEALDEVADRADDLVSATDPSDLLGASGLGDDDEPPAALPAAVASGEPEDVARLRALLTAAKLSTATVDRAEHVGELESLVETAQGDSAAEAETASETTEGGAETTTAAAAEENAATEAEPTEAEPTETDQEGDEESASASPIRELLESQLEETLGIFDGIPDLEQFAGGLGEDDEEDTETAEDEREEDRSTRSRDGTRWRPGGGTQRTTHSTIPSTGRRDIGRRPGRFSSARGSTVSKR
ncbi:MAG: hypothetical protein ACOC0Z_03940 [Halohasta sp.]